MKFKQNKIIYYNKFKKKRMKIPLYIKTIMNQSKNQATKINFKVFRININNIKNKKTNEFYILLNYCSIISVIKFL